MATRNITLTDSFIFQHFDDIYKLICSGLWFHSNENYKWNIDADKQQVMESIRLFFHLCLNAGRVDCQHQKIEGWITTLTKIACAQRSHGVVGDNQYRVLATASEQITKFLFGCFDWNILAVNPDKSHYKRDNRFIDSFDDRLNYYKERVSYLDSQYEHTAKLLFRTKGQRNSLAHTAYDFYTDRQKCLKDLVNDLKDYIMVFHMIRTLCHEKICRDGESYLVPVNIREDIKELVGLPDSAATIRIAIECVDENSGEPVAERTKDIRLFKVCDKDKDGVALEEVALEDGMPGRFRVAFFNKYIIRLMDEGGQMSSPSELMLIDQGFVEGTTVRVNIPPTGSPKPERISLRELIVYSEKDLPDDVKHLLEEIERVAEKEEYADLARSLVLASATNSERDHKNFLEAVRKVRASMKAEIAHGTPSDSQGFLQSKMEEIQANLAEPYRNDDFRALCDKIDELYDEMGLSTTEGSQGLSAIEQMKRNVADLLDGKGVSIGTTATETINRQHRDTAKLEAILRMAEKFPEVIEAEFGTTWLQDRIENLYVNQTNNYLEAVIPLDKCIHQFRDHLEATVDKQTEDGARTLEYAYILRGFLLAEQPENIIRLVKTCHSLLLFWLDSCKVYDEEAKELKEKVRSELSKISENSNLDLQVPMIKLSESEFEELQTSYDTFKGYVKTLSSRIDLFHKDAEYIDQNVFAREKKELNRLTRFLIFIRLFSYEDWHFRTKETIDVSSEVGFASLKKMTETCGPIAFMHLVCCISKFVSFFILNQKMFNIQFLGIWSKEASPEWNNYWEEWMKGNKEILGKCWNIVAQTQEKYRLRKKEREDNRIPNRPEEDDNKAARILEYQRRQIKANYGDQVPDYIQQILDAHENTLPNHVKSMLLEEVLKPSKCPTENLLLVIDSVLRYWDYSDLGVRISFLSEYVQGDYGKRLITPEAQEDFKSMPLKSQELYLKVLMNQKIYPPRIAGTKSSTRFMMAYRMNFPDGEGGKSYMPEADFFLKMTECRMEEIMGDKAELQVFLDMCQVMYLGASYVSRHPENMLVAAQLKLQTTHFYILCKDYYESQVQAVKIEEGKRPTINLIWWIGLCLELRGKSPIEKLAIKYRRLYFDEYYDKDNVRFKSRWCEVEQDLFNKILKLLPEEAPEVQGDVCRRLWNVLLNNMPFSDIKAKRLMDIKPFFSQEKYDSMLHDFWVNCVYGKPMKISNPSVLSGLEAIRDVFAKYGQNIEVGYDRKPWEFVEILVRISDLSESLKEVLKTSSCSSGS